jgi:hypothetical protein
MTHTAVWLRLRVRVYDTRHAYTESEVNESTLRLQGASDPAPAAAPAVVLMRRAARRRSRAELEAEVASLSQRLQQTQAQLSERDSALQDAAEQQGRAALQLSRTAQELLAQRALVEAAKAEAASVAAAKTQREALLRSRPGVCARRRALARLERPFPFAGLSREVYKTVVSTLTRGAYGIGTLTVLSAWRAIVTDEQHAEV